MCFGNDRDGEKVFGGRFGIMPLPKLEIGVSLLTGKASVAGLVDEDALNAALLAGRIAGVGSDVFADDRPGREIPTFTHENLVAMPHVAGSSLGTIRRRSAVCLDNLDRIAQGLEPNYRVR